MPKLRDYNYKITVDVIIWYAQNETTNSVGLVYHTILHINTWKIHFVRFEST
jgi:hypothetical protein